MRSARAGWGARAQKKKKPNQAKSELEQTDAFGAGGVGGPRAKEKKNQTNEKQARAHLLGWGART
jgi:hypothetical protein